MENDQVEQSKALIEQVLQGDKQARRKLNRMVHEMICRQSEIFCKRFCYHNRFQYNCTLLSNPWPRNEHPYCEWGNGSYAWMLEDLTKDQQLRRYEGRHGAALKHYYYYIVHSLAFYERWKQWRFQGGVRVPVYIKNLAPLADKVFYALYNRHDLKDLAQQLGQSEDEIHQISENIITELAKRHKLYLLNQEKILSLTEWESDDETTPPRELQVESEGTDYASLEEQEKLMLAWQKLAPEEQFVLEAMIIDRQDANAVLASLEKLNISIAKKGSVKADRQQLYYFRRKCLAKLADAMGIG